MNKKVTTFFSVLIIIVFIGYIIYDSIGPVSISKKTETPIESPVPDAWELSGELLIEKGTLKAVSVSEYGNIYVGGDSYVQCYNKELKQTWDLSTPYPVIALTNNDGHIYAATQELILKINSEGLIEDEWGPFEDEAIITSVTSNTQFIAFSDAGNKMVFILDKTGVVKSLIGLSGEKFIVPSPYFDVALDNENNLLVANTGHRRVETRSNEGDLLNYFGEPGTAPGAFCGCCNPAHFIMIPEGFATAEKGINRIKILGKDGEFIEFVSSKNKFTPSVPLDLASADGKTIYAANPADSKLYIFTRK